mmetsp:Transcript_12905/g.41364  ORF Transcript_12905/g.41364 Transcript_12905/m.41364 type:complete len:225 (-) Transcript_12905:380-1054(-)
MAIGQRQRRLAAEHLDNTIQGLLGVGELHLEARPGSGRARLRGRASHHAHLAVIDHVPAHELLRSGEVETLSRHVPPWQWRGWRPAEVGQLAVNRLLVAFKVHAESIACAVVTKHLSDRAVQNLIAIFEVDALRNRVDQLARTVAAGKPRGRLATNGIDTAAHRVACSKEQGEALLQRLDANDLSSRTVQRLAAARSRLHKVVLPSEVEFVIDTKGAKRHHIFL